MNKQKGVLIFLSAILIILELLPYGAVLNLSPEGDSAYRETYSYFDLLPYGLGNIFPFIIALLSCVLMCLVLIYAFKNKALTVIKVISIIIFIISLYPIIVGMSYFSIVGIVITVIAFAEAVWSFVIGQSAK